MKKNLYVLFAAGILLAGISGCVQQQEPGVLISLVTIQVTDKVADEFSHVNITFSEIKLFYPDGNSSSDSFVIITSEQKTVDLVFLNLNHLNETLGVAEIEVGNYSKLWIHVTNATGVLNATGETVSIEVPSEWLKIQQLHLFNISEGNTTITIDIDLEHSIHSYAHGTKYKFIPVISSIAHHHEHQLVYEEKEQKKLKEMTENRPPEIDVIVDGAILGNNKIVYVNAGESVEFNASGSFDPEGDDLTFTWDFDDDSNATTGAVVTHSFAEQNQPYTVVVTVSDGGSEETETIRIHIN